VCAGRGYYKRTAVFELLVPDEAFRKKVRERASTEELHNFAVAHLRFEPMSIDAIHKVLAHEIDVEQARETLTAAAVLAPPLESQFTATISKGVAA
jgi:type II secretory ATPase GspE/PulE/Tfp pilus assembly ATPase PilB-like protein